MFPGGDSIMKIRLIRSKGTGRMISGYAGHRVTGRLSYRQLVGLSWVVGALVGCCSKHFVPQPNVCSKTEPVLKVKNQDELDK